MFFFLHFFTISHKNKGKKGILLQYKEIVIEFLYIYIYNLNAIYVRFLWCFTKKCATGTHS